MTVARSAVLLAAIVLSAFSMVPPPADAQTAIKCRSVLGPGQYTLTKDLTCPLRADETDTSTPALTLGAGASLNMNGRTVDCAGRRFGIAVSGGSVFGGTVKGCTSAGVYPAASTVRGLALLNNQTGVYVQAADDNLVISNTATGNGVGFLLEDGAKRNKLINNTAIGGTVGFRAVDGSGNAFINNTGTDASDVGFQLNGTDLRVVGNQARRNSDGFYLVSVAQAEVAGNVAKNNRASGFRLEPIGTVTGVVLRDNLSQGNDGDGIVVKRASLDPVSPSDNAVKDNVILNNGRNGISVVDGLGATPLATGATISGNIVSGHASPYFDLADVNASCGGGVVWEANTFGTASQPCID